jgi:peptide/nickel transport system substrate-binding protein
MLLASGWSPVYPCHVPTRDMRSHPIGTGPFKFVEFKPNESIKVTRAADYWKKDRPYLDGIEFTIIRNMSTAALAFVSGSFDMTFPYSLTVPLLKDARSQRPDAICELTPNGGINSHLLVNRDKPPFDSPELRHAMALSLDRKAFIDILSEGHRSRVLARRHRPFRRRNAAGERRRDRSFARAARLRGGSAGAGARRL